MKQRIVIIKDVQFIASNYLVIHARPIIEFPKGVKLVRARKRFGLTENGTHKLAKQLAVGGGK